VDVTLTTRPVEFDPEGDDVEPKRDDDATVPSSSEALGIKVGAIPQLLRQQLQMDGDSPGVRIISVDPESDAAEEGLEPRQIITAVDDIPITSVADWNRVVKNLKPGETVKVDVAFGAVTQIVFLSVPQPKSK